MSNDFFDTSAKAITDKIKYKVVKKFDSPSEWMDDFLELEFTDGSVLRFHYDYIYSWDFKPAPHGDTMEFKDGKRVA